MQPVPYRGLEKVAFNQPENNLNSALKHLCFEICQEHFQSFIFPGTAGEMPLK